MTFKQIRPCQGHNMGKGTGEVVGGGYRCRRGEGRPGVEEEGGQGIWSEG